MWYSTVYCDVFYALAILYFNSHAKKKQLWIDKRIKKALWAFHTMVRQKTVFGGHVSFTCEGQNTEDDLVSFSSSGQAEISFLKVNFWSVPAGLPPCWPRGVLTGGQSCSMLPLPARWRWCEWTLVSPPHPPVGRLAFQLAPLKRIWQQAEVTAAPLQCCGPSAGVVEHNDISNSGGGQAVAK